MTQFRFRWPTYFGDVVYSSDPTPLASLTWGGQGSKASLYHGPRQRSAWRSASGRSLLRATTALVAATVDGDVRALVLGTTANAYGGFTAYCRALAAGTTVNEGYFLWFPAAGTTVELAKYNAGSYTQLQSATLASLGISLPCQVRLQAVGSTIRAKIWSLDQPEPAGWALSVTDTTITAAGYCGIGCSVGERTVLSDFSVGTDADSAQPLFATLAGSVNEDVPPMTPRQRIVRAVARENQNIYFQTTSLVDGTFTLYVFPEFTYSVYVMDEDGGPYNALISDRLVPY